MSKKRKSVKTTATGKRLQALHLLRVAVDTGSSNEAVPKKVRKELSGLLKTVAKAERKAGRKHAKAKLAATPRKARRATKAKLDQAASLPAQGRQRGKQASVAGARARKRARRR